MEQKNDPVFSVNIEHPLYKVFENEYLNRTSDEEANFNLSCIFHLLPDYVCGYYLDDYLKEDLLWQLRCEIKFGIELTYHPDTGNITKVVGDINAEGLPREVSVLRSSDCLFQIPCPHPLYINTLNPVFKKYIAEYLQAPIESRSTMEPPAEALPLLPDTVLQVKLSNPDKAVLLKNGKLVLQNRGTLLFDHNRQSFSLTDTTDGKFEPSTVRPLLRRDCTFIYEVPHTPGVDRQVKPSKNGNLNLEP
jgi:hypothetical protein